MEGGPYVGLKTDAIYDWTSFHAECQRAFGFPPFYARDMDSWIECMATLRSDDGLVSIKLPAGERAGVRIRDLVKELELTLPGIRLARLHRSRLWCELDPAHVQSEPTS